MEKYFSSAIVSFYRIRELAEEIVIVGKADGAGITKCRNLPENQDFQRHMHVDIEWPTLQY